MNHTPGPWTVGRTLLTSLTRKWSKREWEFNEEIEKHLVFATFHPFDRGRGRVRVAGCTRALFTRVQSIANANLIAAAPEMFDALVEIENLAMRSDEPWAQIAHAAIAKATAAPAAKDTDNG